MPHVIGLDSHHRTGFDVRLHHRAHWRGVGAIANEAECLRGAALNDR
jgi:hypothetical protein